MKNNSRCSRFQLSALAIASFFILSFSSLAQAVTLDTITFDSLRDSSAYIENGYQFVGAMIPDGSFSTSPAMRIYGNNPLTISRVDGALFSVERFDLLYRYSTDTPWWFVINNNNGFQLTRDGTYESGQFSPLTNIQFITIYDQSWRSTNYYIFDNFTFSSSSTVPIPAAFWLFGSGLIGMLGFMRRRKS